MIAPPSAGKSADTNCRDAPALWVSGAVSDVALLIHLILDSIIQDAGIEVRGPVRPRYHYVKLFCSGLIFRVKGAGTVEPLSHHL